MKLYEIRFVWDKSGNRYPCFDSVRVKATSLRAAVGKAMGPTYKKERKGWREVAGANFIINLSILGDCEEWKPEPKVEEGGE